MEESPICPKCKINMELRKTMAGDRWICGNYAYCGQSVKYIERRVENNDRIIQECSRSPEVKEKIKKAAMAL